MNSATMTKMRGKRAREAIVAHIELEEAGQVETPFRRNLTPEEVVVEHQGCKVW